jgi:hypothetical protein
MSSVLTSINEDLMSYISPPGTNLDATQVIRRVYDEANNKIRVDAVVSAVIGTVDVILNSATDNVAIASPGGNFLLINPDGSINVNSVVDQASDSIRLGDGVNLITSTAVSSKHGLDVNIIGGVVSGTFDPSGLKTALRPSVLTVTDVATAVPVSPLANRNTMTVRIWGTNTVYFGDSTVTSTNGYPKMQSEEIFIDIKDNPSVELYAICASGETCEIRILEIA